MFNGGIVAETPAALAALMQEKEPAADASRPIRQPPRGNGHANFGASNRKPASEELSAAVFALVDAVVVRRVDVQPMAEQAAAKWDADHAAISGRSTVLPASAWVLSRRNSIRPSRT
jgi:hypothetical protein